MPHEHSHVSEGAGHEKQLVIALALTGAYLMAEVIGGIVTQSLALLSDAAHMLTDVMALVIALVAIRVGKRPADRKRTFGYARFEILAAAFNAATLFVIAFYILYQAVQRFKSPPEIQTIPMLIVAVIGLGVNIVSFRVLQSGSDKSLNVKGAYLEVLSDLLGSVAVIVGALIIRFTGWWQVDPILAVLIGLWVLPRTAALLKESGNVLLEGVPTGIDTQEVYAALSALPGVREVHDLHIWEITQGQSSLTAHLVVDSAPTNDDLVRAAQNVAGTFQIEHTTFQVETTAMPETEHEAHPFPAKQ